MRKFLEKKYINISFTAALIILIAVNIIIYFNIRFHFEDEAIINKSLTTIQLSEELYSKIIEAETNRRGYIITNNYEFLKSYYIAFNLIDSAYIKLKNIKGKDDKEKLDSLWLLIYDRKDLLEESIELQEKKINTKQEQINYTTMGKIIVDKIKWHINDIQTTEKQIINDRLKTAQESSNSALINLITGNIIAFILLISSVVLLNRNITKRKEIEKRLEEYSNRLETTLASIADAVITISNIGEAVFLNKQAEAITGWKTEEVKGLMVNHILNIYSENGKTRKIDINKDILSVKNTINLSENYYLLNKNSKKIYINCRAAPIITSLDKFIGVVMIIQDVTEKRIAELEISNSQKFIKRITDSIPSIVYIFNVKENRISYVNYKIEELLGFKADDVINSSEIFFEKVINPADLKKFQQNLYRYKSLNDFEIIEYEYRILNSKNDYKWFKSYEVVFSRDENGYTAEILGTAFDIDSRKLLEEELKKYSGQLEELVEYRTKELTYTNEMLKNEIKERKRAEKILTEAEEKFRSLVENSIVGIYIIQNDKYVYANPKFAEIFGYEKNEIIGMDIWKLVLPENKRIINEIINKGINNEIDSIQYTFKAIKKNQEIIEAEVKGTTMLYEGKISIIGTLQDVTERNKAEVLLNEQRKYLRSVIDTNPSFIFAKDWEGRFTLVNKAVAEVYGTTVNELIGKTDADYNKRIEEVEQFNRDDREVISSRISKFIPEEKVTNSVTGETRWYQTVKVPITGIDGRVQVLGVSSDITERKRAEELLMKSLNEKEMLLKEIHHRVKNNLQIIISLLKLQSGYVYDVRDIEIFNNSRSRIETMSLIHEKLYRTEDLSSIEISNYVKELVNHLIKAYNINSALVDFTVSSEKIYLSIDTAIPCGLIINELVNNTLKHAFPRGYRGKILINIKKENEIIFISIKDNGIGLPENLDEKVNKSLGLQLINTLIKQLDGVLEIYKNNGTEFVIKFKEITYKERI